MSRFAYADLHIHTTVSDGSEDFETIIHRAAALGLTHIAFTNHDTLSGIATARAAAADSRVSVIGGVEISAWDACRETRAHILGLGFRSQRAPAIAALCAPLLAQRDAQSHWQLEQLCKHGYQPDLEKVRRLSQASSCLYKQHLMAALTDAAFTSSAYQSLYRCLFKGGGICDRDISYVDARDAVQAIVEDGGVAVLAHPGQFGNFDLVGDLVAVGLRGIEKYHPAHHQRERQIVEQLAGEYGLVCTGGSDYHGRFGAPPQIGVQLMTAAPGDGFLAELS
ncbi:MAG: PHP domain-containing protein [Coriobacteriales bacterium]|nr:PHP domain-containing protein [Coriobacteriales bacterium]